MRKQFFTGGLLLPKKWETQERQKTKRFIFCQDVFCWIWFVKIDVCYDLRGWNLILCYPFGQIKLDERLYFYHYLATPIVKIDTQCSTAYLCGLQDIKICPISLDFLERSWGIFFFEKSDRTISIFLGSGN